MAKLKVLLLTRYASLGASSRVRFYQYLSYLEGHGIQVDAAPLFDNEYLTRLYSGRRPEWRALAKAYFKRISVLCHAQRYDLVWLEYEALPWLPAWLEMRLGLARRPFIVDYDDAIFHRYDLNRSRFVRALLGNKIDLVMRNSRLVIAGNDYLADRATSAGAQNVEILPTVVDAERYRPQHNTDPDVVTIGWIGSPSTQHYLDLVLPAISRLYAIGQPIRLAVVGGRVDGDHNFPVVNIPWTEAGEVGVIQTFDVGIMPLLDSPWERGKCGYKLIQYMACGKPVVASPVGVNRSIVTHGVNGFLAQSVEDWLESLQRLIENPSLRAEMGRLGRARVEAEFSLGVTAPKLKTLLEEWVTP